MHHASRKVRGFTLIEMLCAVSVAGFLSSVAYPGFLSVIHKTRRADALVAAMQVQMAQERHRSGNAAYGSLEDIGVAAVSPQRHYTLVIGAVSESGYELIVTATGSQAKDADCRVMKLKLQGHDLTQSSGASTTVDNPAEVNRKCWIQ
jgi:type IV pilus assembly protein PilE